MARPTTRRSSARLRKRSTTPKFPGAFPEEDTQAPEKSNLDSVPETEETGETVATPAKTTTIPLNDAMDIQATPAQNTPIRPEPEEMHPGHYQSTTSKPLEEARWLGFMEKGSHTEPPKGSSKIPMLQNTPTKIARMPGTFSPPGFQFTFRHPSLELSPSAKQMMAETREEAGKIRAQMSSEGSALPSIQEEIQRKIARPKGKAGRFSDAHMAEFKKMDSIANHASSFRADPSRSKQGETSLKRTSSKAGLDKSEPSTTKDLKCNKPKNDSDGSEEGKHTSRPTKFKVKTSGLEAASPLKRIKAHHEEEIAALYSVSRDSHGQSQTLNIHLQDSHLPAVATTPTKSSLARSDSAKSVKSGIPSLARSPSKHSAAGCSSGKSNTISLLARSASKKNGSAHAESNDGDSALPLLARSPSKKPAGQQSSAEEESDSATPLLSRSPAKKPVKLSTTEDGEELQGPTTPLLSRSPSKKAVAHQQDESDQPVHTSKVPLLSRTPAKLLTVEDSPFLQPARPGQTPTVPSSSLRNRFAALRGAGSAMKSILRSPQRLYSDDPFKIAAGTHVPAATPPRSIIKPTGLKEPPTVSSIKKHVDFDNSPAVEKRAIGSPSPIKARSKVSEKMDIAWPSLPGRDQLPNEAHLNMQPEYPDLRPARGSTAPAEDTPMSSPVPTAPGTFTFRVGDPINFGPPAPSANRKTATPQSPALMKPTIRHVRPSIAPAPSHRKSTATTGASTDDMSKSQGRKRKLSSTEQEDEDKENTTDVATMTTPSATQSIFDIPVSSDSPETRPAKKVRRSDSDGHAEKGMPRSEVKKAKTPTRLPKLGGVRGSEKARKRTSAVLSQARLNLLATPKRRKGE
ncbi:MAG: hypothetical protein Q9165_008612 [Trypethelium subeluteriae]